MSVTPTVCITLAFWLGRGSRIWGACWADTKGAAHALAMNIKKDKKESLFWEIMVALLFEEILRIM
jgi:hypothetical protein